MRAATKLSFLTAALSAVAVWACSSSGPEFPDAGSFCTGLAKAECGEAANCETSMDTCVTERTSICNATATSASASGRVYQSDAAPACVNLARSTYAATNVKITQPQLLAVDTTCDKVFIGHAADGQPCTEDVDCENNEICDTRVNVCAKEVDVAPAGFCGEPGQVCPDDSYCDGLTITSKCVASPTLGGACSSAIPCADSFRCIEGFCAARATQSEPCGTDSDCDPTAPFCNIYDPPARCTTGEIFSPSETDLCQDFGGSTTPFVPGAPGTGTADAGIQTPEDSGVAATDSAAD